MSSSSLLNNANKDVNQLLDYTNKSLQSINNKQKDLKNLVDSVQNFTALNADKSKKIEAVILNLFVTLLQHKTYI